MTRTHDPDEYRLLHAAALLTLFCVGVYMSSFGPALPFIAGDLGVSLDTAGLMLTAIFTGSILSSAGVAIWLHGRHPRHLTIAGLVSATAGVLLIGVAPVWPFALLGGAALGAGDGLIIAALHILMAQTSRDAAGAINRLNLYFAFGAMVGPVWAAGLLEATDERWIVYTGIAALTSITLMVLLAAPAPSGEQNDAPGEVFRLPGTPRCSFLHELASRSAEAKSRPPLWHVSCSPRSDRIRLSQGAPAWIPVSPPALRRPWTPPPFPRRSAASAASLRATTTRCPSCSRTATAAGCGTSTVGAIST